MSNGNEKPRIFLISHSRTTCHLFEKMLSAQPHTLYASHFTWGAHPLLSKILYNGSIDACDDETRDEYIQLQATAYENLKTFFDTAEREEKNSFYHDHVIFMLNPVVASDYIHGTTKTIPRSTYDIPHVPDIPVLTSGIHNPTVYPDSLWTDQRNKFIFIIRHPLLMVPGIYRANQTWMSDRGGTSWPVLQYTALLHWNRLFYDWLAEYHNPIIIDADDYLDTGTDGTVKPSATMKKTVDLVGLDSDAIITTWEKAKAEEIEGYYRGWKRMGKDVYESKGIRLTRKKKGRDMVMEEEKIEWRKEFGHQGMENIEMVVKVTMPDYEYLWDKRIQA